MAITARRLRRLEAWSDWRAAGGTRQAVVDDALSIRASAVLENEQLIVTLPLDSPAAGSLGARKIVCVDQADAYTNFALWAGDFTNAAWTKRGTAGVGGKLDPLNGTNGFEKILTSAGTEDIFQSIAGYAANANLATSIWIRVVSAGTGSIKIANPADSTKFFTVVPTSQWVRYSGTFAATAAGAGGVFLFSTDASAWTVQIFGAQQQLGAIASAYAPTTTAPVTVDAVFDEYRIVDRGTDDDQSVLVVTASPFRLTDLQGAGLISRKDTDGVVVYDFEVLGLTPSEVITNWVLPALVTAGFGWVALGTITPTARLDMTFSWDTPLAVLLRLATSTQGEIDLRKNGSTGYVIDLVTKVNSAAQQADLRVDKNLVNVTRSESSIDQATRVFPKGAAQDSMAATMARATWQISAITGLDLTLADPAGGKGPIQFDGQLAGADDVASSGIVARWPFDGAATDLSGNGRDGVAQNGASFVTGKVGQAISLDGLNDHVTVVNHASLKWTGQDFTVAGWVNIDPTDADGGYIISKPWNGSGQYNWNLFWNSTGILTLNLLGATSYSLSTVAKVPPGGWHHVGFTIDSATKLVTIYIDGVAVATGTHAIVSWVPTLGDNNEQLAIGTLYPYGTGWAGVTAQAIKGLLDDVRIYSRDLAASEFSALACTPAALTPAYLRKLDGTLVKVIGSAAPNIVRVAATTGIAVNDVIQFRASSAGDDLAALEAPAAIGAYGVKGAVRDVGDVPATNNLVKNAAMRVWPGGAGSLPTNWSAVGVPTIAKQVAAPFTAIGGQSIKVTSTADGQGVISDAVPIFPTALAPYISGFAKLWVASGNARVELVISTPSGTKVFPLLPNVASATVLGQWEDIGASGYDANGVAATTAAIRIVQNGVAASVFYVDAGQITQSASQMPWFEGSGGTRLWQEANEALRTGSAPVVSFTVPLVDLESFDPVTWSESALILGANARVTDPRLALDIVTRIVGIDRDYMNPQATSVTLSNRFDDLTDILAASSRPGRTATGTNATTVDTGVVERPTATVSFDSAGHPTVNLIGGPGTVSMKIEVSSVSSPSDAAVEATTAVEGSAALISYSSPIIPVNGVLYLKAFDYSKPTGGGTRSLALEGTVTREGAGAPNPPNADWQEQAISQTSTTYRLTGSVGPGGIGPLQYRTRIDFNGGTGTWSSWAAFPSGGGTYVDVVTARSIFYPKYLIGQVRDASAVPVESSLVTVAIVGQFSSHAPTSGHIDPVVPTHSGFNVFQYGSDTAAGVIETAGQSFTNGIMLDGSRRIINVYRSATSEPVANLFKRGSNDAGDVVTTTARTFVDPTTSTQVDGSGRIVGVYRLGVIEPVNNLVKSGDSLPATTFSGLITGAAAGITFPVNTTNSQGKFGTLEIQGFALNNGWLGENTYYDGSVFKYRATGYAARLYFQGSSVHLDVAASGTAGTTPTFINALSVNASNGNISAAAQILASAQITAETYFCLTRGGAQKGFFWVSTGADQGITGSVTDDIMIRAAASGARILFSTDNGGSIGAMVTTNGSLNTKGQVRSTGWWASGDSVGAGAEMGYSGSQAHFLGFNRTSSAYIDVRLRGVNVILEPSGTGLVQINDGVTSARQVACVVFSASAPTGSDSAPDGTIWIRT